MNKKWWIIGGLIVIGAGIGAYFLFRKPKDDEEDNNGENNRAGNESNEVNQNVVTSPAIDYTKSETKFPIKMGSKGKKVYELQNHLICLGRDLGRAGADGIWGELTEQAMLKQPPKMNVLTNTSDYNTALGRMSAVIYRSADKRKCLEKA